MTFPFKIIDAYFDSISKNMPKGFAETSHWIWACNHVYISWFPIGFKKRIIFKVPIVFTFFSIIQIIIPYGGVKK